MKIFYSNLMLHRLLFVLMISTVASGCASGPLEPTQPPSPLSVAQIRATLAENEYKQFAGDGQVLWGGIILKVENLSDATRIEIMGHPLDRRQRPLSAKEAQGRFIARYEDFLEPLEYPVGRSITVLGSLAEPLSGKVGAADYLYPVVRVEQTHLWREQDLPQRPRLTFGVGISLGN